MKKERYLGDLNQWTKTELAQVINQALHCSHKPFKADHFKVKRMAKANNKVALIESCERAINALASMGK